jgi:hypothetical protein
MKISKETQDYIDRFNNRVPCQFRDVEVKQYKCCERVRYYCGKFKEPTGEVKCRKCIQANRNTL